ncbi:hypothetical protein [Pelagibius sp.]|uniref:hypothetical protein n=1 Tax=Pelagibius sp. TaxID=1931238 RepID=UPI003BAF4EB0
MIITVDFISKRTTASHLAAARTSVTGHPVLAPLLGKMDTDTKAAVQAIISQASAEGLTTATAARKIRDELGINKRAAEIIVRTGLSIIADRTR